MSCVSLSVSLCLSACSCVCLSLVIDEGLERVTDNNGWTAFMHAARGTHNEKVFQALCNVYESDKDVLAAELAKIGDDGTSLLTHATLGGHSSFTTVRKLLSSGSGYVNHPEKEDERVLVEAKLLSSAAEGGGIKVLNKVADGIKVGHKGTWSFTNWGGGG